MLWEHHNEELGLRMMDGRVQRLPPMTLHGAEEYHNLEDEPLGDDSQALVDDILVLEGYIWA